MIDITPSVPQSANIIASYGNGGFVVRDIFYPGSHIVTLSHVLSWKGEIAHSNLQEICNVIKALDDFEVLLIGTGQKNTPYPAILWKEQRNFSIAIDVMDTGAACRTYNVLLAEGRKVAAALIAV